MNKAHFHTLQNLLWDGKEPLRLTESFSGNSRHWTKLSAIASDMIFVIGFCPLPMKQKIFALTGMQRIFFPVENHGVIDNNFRLAARFRALEQVLFEKE